MIFPEAGLGVFDPAAERRRRWIWRGTLAGAVFLTAALGLAFLYAFLRWSGGIADQERLLADLSGRLSNVAARQAPTDPLDLDLALEAASTVEAARTEVPQNATNLQVSESAGRVETFVTAGKPTTTALKTDNIGLELVPITHPNDLYATEEAKFRFLLDGKPAAGLELEIVAGGTRYRDQQNEIKVKTDGNGEFAVTWPQPGMYWLEATLQDEKTSVKQAKQRRVSYVATFEEVPLARTGDKEADIDATVLAYTQVLERYVREHPEQYFWQHRRWKGQPSDTPPHLKEP